MLHLETESTNQNHCISKYIAMRCIANPKHSMFKHTDGACCAECNGSTEMIFISEAKYNQLPTYEQLRKERKNEQKAQKAYHSAGITNISSILNYDRSGFHNLTIDIAFMHKGSGFEKVGNAYEELVADIHKLLLESKTGGREGNDRT